MNREQYSPSARRPSSPALALGLSGAAMAAYLLLRPYGDVAEATLTAALTSPRWVIAHLCGMLALCAVGLVPVLLRRSTGSPLLRAGARTGSLGAALVLPYYGMETFALPVLANGSLPGQELDGMVESVRGHPVAMVMFGLGLVLLGVTAVLVSLWCVRGGTAPLVAWPFAVLVAGVLPQYYLPPTGRLLFGLVYAGAALLLASRLPELRRSVGPDDRVHLEVHGVGVAPVATPGESPLLEDRDHPGVHVAGDTALVGGGVQVDGDPEGVQ